MSQQIVSVSIATMITSNGVSFFPQMRNVKGQDFHFAGERTNLWQALLDAKEMADFLGMEMDKYQPPEHPNLTEAYIRQQKEIFQELS